VAFAGEQGVIGTFTAKAVYKLMAVDITKIFGPIGLLNTDGMCMLCLFVIRIVHATFQRMQIHRA